MRYLVIVQGTVDDYAGGHGSGGQQLFHECGVCRGARDGDETGTPVRETIKHLADQEPTQPDHAAVGGVPERRGA